MKNQYVGDIGDYGKYGLLRFLTNKGIIIGVNWYLTDNDGTNDGRIREYLDDAGENGEKCYDEILFEKLKPIAKKDKDNRSIHDVERNAIIPDAIFYHEPLKRKKADRDKWHASALKKLQAAALIFADPDNGTLIEEHYGPNSEKYAFIRELREYYDKGKDVVYYCHKGRRREDNWKSKLDEFNRDGHNARIFALTFHRGTQRSFVFAIHPENEKKYNELLQSFIDTTAWGTNPVKRKKIPFTLDKTPTD